MLLFDGRYGTIASVVLLLTDAYRVADNRTPSAMRREIRQAFNVSMWALMVTVVACATESDRRGNSHAPAVPPIIYAKFSDPCPLTDAQVREVQSSILESGLEPSKVWFICVSYSRGGIYRGAVYYKPEMRDGRVRRGYAIAIGNDAYHHNQREATIRQGGRWPITRPYVQITVTDEAGRIEPPRDIGLPFSPPVGFSNSKLVAIIDAARVATADDIDASRMPICRVEDGWDGHIRVVLGWQAGSLYGGGRYVEMKWDGQRYSVIGVGFWMS